MSTSTGPLTDLTVLDLSTIISGGTVTSLLADLGAQVIKVEHPKGGDPLRSWAPFVGGQSIWWKVVSRNKKSITLNLSQAPPFQRARAKVLHEDVGSCRERPA